MNISKKNCKILCITGTRADYPRVKSVLKELDSNENFDLQIIATGSHLLKDYGYSVQEIIDDGFDLSHDELNDNIVSPWNVINKNNKVYGIDNLDNYYSTKLKKKRLEILKKNKNFLFIKKDIYHFKYFMR